MNETALSETKVIDVQRARLRFRSWHRGTREMDLLLGRFADTHLPTCSAADLDAYEALLVEGDPDLYAWITGAGDPPAEHQGAVMDRLRAMYATR